jgi:hypothetical protein
MFFGECDERSRPEFQLLDIAGKECDGRWTLREGLTPRLRMIGVFDCASRLYSSLIWKSQ